MDVVCDVMDSVLCILLYIFVFDSRSDFFTCFQGFSFGVLTFEAVMNSPFHPTGIMASP